MRSAKSREGGQGRKELVGGQERGQGGRREAGLLRASSVPSPTLTHHRSTPLGMCTCRGRVPHSTLVPGCKGFRSSDAPGCLRRLLLSHLPLPGSPCTSWPGFAGLVSGAEGQGAIALYILEKTLGEGRGRSSPPVPAPRPPPQPSPPGSVSLLCASQGPHPKPLPDSLPAPVLLGQHLPHLGGAAHTKNGRECMRVHRGLRGPEPMGLWPQEQPGSRDHFFQNLCLTFP